MLKRDKIAMVKLCDLGQPDFADWRDRRLMVVSAGTVRREWVLMSGACTVAVNEWHWLPTHPMKGVKRPTSPRPRDRLVSDREHGLMAQSFGDDLNTIIGRVLKAFLFSCETGMREGEVAGLNKNRLHLDQKYLKIDDGKTSAAKRDVPLSPVAIAIAEEAVAASTTESVFNLTTSQIDSHFRKGRDKALIKDLHYHDSRHVAITKLSKKLDILELARAVGIRDLKTLMVYYNETAEELAKKL
jgi:integrase